jgi:hypothetical protein
MQQLRISIKHSEDSRFSQVMKQQQCMTALKQMSMMSTCTDQYFALENEREAVGGLPLLVQYSAALAPLLATR